MSLPAEIAATTSCRLWVGELRQDHGNKPQGSTANIVDLFLINLHQLDSQRNTPSSELLGLQACLLDTALTAVCGLPYIALGTCTNYRTRDGKKLCRGVRRRHTGFRRPQTPRSAGKF
jgi:hypothetical protein